MRVYVASPYQIPSVLSQFLTSNCSQKDLEALVTWRAQATTALTAHLQRAAWVAKKPIFFYSPIAYETALIDSLPLDKQTGYRGDGEYWMEVDRNILPSMDACVVLSIPGWTRSTGVWEEVNHFTDLIGAKVVRLTLSGETVCPASSTVHTLNKIFHGFESMKFANIFPRGGNNSCPTWATVINYLTQPGGFNVRSQRPA